jgi:hypothetical protein
MTVLILLAIGGLLLLFKSTRLVGVAGLTLLFIVVPFAFLFVLLLGCVFLYFKFKRNRRLYVYRKPELPD